MSQTKISKNSPVEFNEQGEMQVKVDGFEQVLAMLKIADPEFRESLLRRLASRDRALAESLRADLGM